MPIFDYRCLDCSKSSEILVRGGAPALCPACGSARMEKLVSLPAAPGQSKVLVARARVQASKEGHFSHYKASERPR